MVISGIHCWFLGYYLRTTTVVHDTGTNLKSITLFLVIQSWNKTQILHSAQDYSSSITSNNLWIITFF